MQKKCEYCSTLFTGKRRSRKYCSDNCKQMAYYKRNGLVLAGGYGDSFRSSPDSVKYDIALRKADSEPVLELPLMDDPTELAETTDLQDPERILQYFTINDFNREISDQNEDVVIPPALKNERIAPSKPVTVKYQWVDSIFLEHVQRFSQNDNFAFLKYRFNAEYVRVLECFKCLAGVLIQLSNRPTVNPDFFLKIVAAFTSLVQSEIFNSIPAHFPFLSVIRELNEKLTMTAKQGEVSKVYLSPKRKAFLIAILFKMGKDIKDLKVSQIMSL